MIRFKQDISLEVVSDFNEDEDIIVDQDEQFFTQGSVVDGDIFFDDGSDYVDIQYADGSISTNVPRDCFEII